jgi:riboflavin biosynthesis pyrimidine reductase
VQQLHPTVRDLTPEDLYDLYDEPGPYLRAGFVSSVDGAISVDGRSGGLSSPGDKAVFRALRAVADAVVVGAGTVRTEDYGPVRLQPAAVAWRAAHGRSPEIPLVIVSRTGDVGSGKVLQGPVISIGPDLPTEIAGLHERGLTRLLCEGGPSLFTSLLRAGLVDELCLTTSPQLVGSGPRLLGDLTEPLPLHLTSLIHDDPGVLLGRWSVVRSSDD